MELAFLSLERSRKGVEQVQELDSDMLLSFVMLICVTCKVRLPSTQHAVTPRRCHKPSQLPASDVACPPALQ